MNTMTIVTIVVNALCGLWLCGLAVFVIVKRRKIKKEAKKELEEMYDGEKLSEEESVGKESKED